MEIPREKPSVGGVWIFSGTAHRSYNNNSCVYCFLYNNQINTRALIGQSAMVYCAINPWKKCAASELLYESNRPQVSMAYRLINHLGCC